MPKSHPTTRSVAWRSREGRNAAASAGTTVEVRSRACADALHDASILVRAITAGGPDAARHYQAERDELSLRLFRVTGRIAAFDWTADEIGVHLHELKNAMAEEVAAMTGPDQPVKLAS